MPESTMDKKPHILFLSHYFPPETNAPSIRTFEHCKKWIDEADVTVLTNFPNHPIGKIYNGYKNRLVKEENYKGINVIRLLTFCAANEGKLLRIINYVWYMLASLIYSIVTKKKFDLVIATTPQFFCGMAGKYVSKILKTPFILEVRDIWPASISAVNAMNNKKILHKLETAEISLYKSADKIITVTESFKTDIIKKGINENKISVCYNGVLLDFFTNGKRISSKNLRAYQSTGFKVGYIGTIGMAHSLQTMIEAADRLKKIEKIKFIIIGSGAEYEIIKQKIKDRGLKNIRVYPNQPHKDIPSIIDKMDIFLVHLKKVDLFKTVIPSKIFEGMAMKKPILLGVDGEARNIIERANCGYFFEPENVDDLVTKILLLYNNGAKSRSLGLNGYNYVREHFNRAKIAKEYFKINKSVMK